MAQALRDGNLGVMGHHAMRNIMADTEMMDLSVKQVKAPMRMRAAAAALKVTVRLLLAVHRTAGNAIRLRRTWSVGA